MELGAFWGSCTLHHVPDAVTKGCYGVCLSHYSTSWLPHFAHRVPLASICSHYMYLKFVVLEFDLTLYVGYHACTHFGLQMAVVKGKTNATVRRVKWSQHSKPDHFPIGTFEYGTYSTCIHTYKYCFWCAFSLCCVAIWSCYCKRWSWAHQNGARREEEDTSSRDTAPSTGKYCY